MGKLNWKRGDSWKVMKTHADALLAEINEKLAAPADNPLLVIEQLRGRVLRYQERKSLREFDEWLNRFQDYCDAVHLSLRKHPKIEHWRTELVAYERAEYQREREARDEATIDAIERQLLARADPGEPD
jgi:hypothetical protein